jgi:hypothetical protein
MKRESSSDLMEQINPNLRKVSFRFVTTLCTSQYGNISLGDQDNCVLCHGHLNPSFGCPSFHVDGIPCCGGVGGGTSTYVGTNTGMITVDGNVPQVGQLILWDNTALMGSIVEITSVNPPYTANNNPHNYSSTSCPNQVYNCSGTSTGCTQSDFDYNGTCGSQWLVPAPGNAPSWDTWLTNQFNAFNGNAGCYQFGAIQTYIGQQLASGVNAQGQPFSQIALDRKQAKSDWAACMQNHCAGGPQAGC